MAPASLESRPDLQEPVERIAVWQDELRIDEHPRAGIPAPPEDKSSSRAPGPTSSNVAQKTSLDSGESIYVWLEPSKVAKGNTTGSRRAPNSPTVDSARGVSGDGGPSADPGTTGGGLGGGGLEVKRILAYRDVHALAPDRKMVGREDLELRFVEADPAPVVASTTSAPSEVPADAPPPEAAQESQPTAPAEGQVAAAQDAEAQKPPAEPTMTGVANHIWATVARKPGAGLDPTSSRRRTRTVAKPKGTTGTIAAADTAGTAGGQAAESEDSDTEVREAWLRGNVALHQDSPPEKPENPDGTKAEPKRQDITGEAVYLDNHKGKGKMLAWVFYRDPHQPPRPGPLPWARVTNGDRTIRSETIRLDQEHDKVWGDGPGVMTQWTDRALLADKAEEPAGESDGATSGGAAAPAADPAASSASAPGRGTRIRTSSSSPPAADPSTGTAPSAKPKPRTRAGRPIPDKELLTIFWKKRMEFTGRTTDPTPNRRPAGRADFFGSPNAITDDAQLKCKDRMIVFTDREVPLGELGSLSKGSEKTGGADAAATDGDGKAKDEPRVDLALIYCYGETVAVSRKIDPDFPLVLEQQTILAERELHYNRLTGDFRVIGPGQVYKWDRSDDSKETKDGPVAEEAKAQDADRVGRQPQRDGRATVPARSVTPTSGRAVTGANGSAGAGRRTSAGSQRRPAPAHPPPATPRACPSRRRPRNLARSRRWS